VRATSSPPRPEPAVRPDTPGIPGQVPHPVTRARLGKASPGIPGTPAPRVVPATPVILVILLPGIPVTLAFQARMVRQATVGRLDTRPTPVILVILLPGIPVTLVFLGRTVRQATAGRLDTRPTPACLAYRVIRVTQACQGTLAR